MSDDQVMPTGDDQAVTPAVEPEEAVEEKTAEDATVADEAKV